MVRLPGVDGIVGKAATFDGCDVGLKGPADAAGVVHEVVHELWVLAQVESQHVMHHQHLARRALALGGYISFSGIITFRNAETIRDVCRMVPADRYLVETDAPYLAPVPHRGQSNEPSFVRHTAAAVAAARGVSLAEVGVETTANFYRLFRKAQIA